MPKYRELSTQQAVCLKSLACGTGHKDIADGLGITVNTVKQAITNAKAKLEAKTTCQAIYNAAKAGMI